MGAYGAAIVAKENYVEGTKSSILGPEELDAFTIENSHARCGRCENNCLLTINKFSDGSKYITGNRCEKGEGKAEGEKNIPNLYDYKFKRLFKYKPLSEEESRLGTIGIPRVLNMYENYPFWFTFFTKLGYRVVLSLLSQARLCMKREWRPFPRIRHVILQNWCTVIYNGWWTKELNGYSIPV